jgi:hypothetical protein
MQCNYIVIGRELFIELHQHLQRLHQLLLVREFHILILNALIIHFNCHSFLRR